jgi:hypothetical protein
MKRKLIGAAALLMTSGVANADDVDDMYKAMTYPMLAQVRWGAPHDGASAPKHVRIAALSDRPIPLIGRPTCLLMKRGRGSVGEE